MNRGTIYALSCYLLWGLLPVYWKALHALPALETTAHRVIWSALVAGLLLVMRRNGRSLRAALRDRRAWLTFGATAALLLFNWLVYIAAINHDQLVETSLGYFMNPLVNVLLAVTFLRERPRPWQWLAIAVASAGVVYLTISYGRPPWVALALAFSFGFYALLKRTSRLAALDGFFLEMALLTLPMLGYLFFLEGSGAAGFGHAGALTTLLLSLSGVVTAIPLILFAAGAQRVPLTLLGLLQYVSPTMQFVLGVLLYREPFTHSQLAGFSFIWTALVLLAVEGVWERRRMVLAPRPVPRSAG
jgi:chloramphenicol-sensitive protein RarD